MSTNETEFQSNQSTWHNQPVNTNHITILSQIIQNVCDKKKLRDVYQPLHEVLTSPQTIQNCLYANQPQQIPLAENPLSQSSSQQKPKKVRGRPRKDLEQNDDNERKLPFVSSPKSNKKHKPDSFLSFFDHPRDEQLSNDDPTIKPLTSSSSRRNPSNVPLDYHGQVFRGKQIIEREIQLAFQTSNNTNNTTNNNTHDSINTTNNPANTTTTNNKRKKSSYEEDCHEFTRLFRMILFALIRHFRILFPKILLFIDQLLYIVYSTKSNIRSSKSNQETKERWFYQQLTSIVQFHTESKAIVSAFQYIINQIHFEEELIYCFLELSKAFQGFPYPEMEYNVNRLQCYFKLSYEFSSFRTRLINYNHLPIYDKFTMIDQALPQINRDEKFQFFCHFLLLHYISDDCITELEASSRAIKSQYLIAFPSLIIHELTSLSTDLQTYLETWDLDQELQLASCGIINSQDSMYSGRIKVKPTTFLQETRNIHKSHQTTPQPVKRQPYKRRETQPPNHILFQIEEIANDSIEYQTITTSSKMIDNLPNLSRVTSNCIPLPNIDSTSTSSSSFSTQQATLPPSEQHLQPSTSSSYPIETLPINPTTSSSSSSSLPISPTNQPTNQSANHSSEWFFLKNIKKVQINENENEIDIISLISIGDSTIKSTESSESIQSIDDILSDDLQSEEEKEINESNHNSSILSSDKCNELHEITHIPLPNKELEENNVSDPLNSLNIIETQNQSDEQTQEKDQIDENCIVN